MKRPLLYIVALALAVSCNRGEYKMPHTARTRGLVRPMWAP